MDRYDDPAPDTVDIAEVNGDPCAKDPRDGDRRVGDPPPCCVEPDPEPEPDEFVKLDPT
jgi:hypothetical protein